MLGVSSDILFPISQQREMVKLLQESGMSCVCGVILCVNLVGD